MRFVPVKSKLAPASALVFRTRDLLVRQRTQLINALQARKTEFGMVVAQGPIHVERLIAIVEDPVSNLREPACIVLGVIFAELHALNYRVSVLDSEGRGFESLQAHLYLSLQLLRFLQVRLCSFKDFRVAPVSSKTIDLQAFPSSPDQRTQHGRNTKVLRTFSN